MRRFALACALAMSSTTSTTLAGEVDKAPAPEDRFLWLEEVSGDKPLEWAKARNAESAKVLVTPEEAALEKRILDILDSKERIPNVQKLGPWYYNFWRDAKNPRGLWRRTTLDEYRKPEPAWETVLDLDALGVAEKENWVWHGADFLQPEYERCLVSALARRGRRRRGPRVRPDGEDVRQGRLLPAGGEEQRLLARRRQPLRRHRLRHGLADDVGLPAHRQGLEARHPARPRPRLVYEGKAEDVAVAAFRDHTKGFERDFVNRAVTFYSDELFVRRDGKLVKIDKPDDAQRRRPPRPAAASSSRTDWTVGGKTYPAGALIAADFEGFLKGERRFDVLFEPTDRQLAGRVYSPTQHYILAQRAGQRAEPALRARRARTASGRASRCPGMPEFGTVTASAVDDEESDDYFMTVADYLTPTSLSLGTVGQGLGREAQAAAGLLRRRPASS